MNVRIFLFLTLLSFPLLGAAAASGKIHKVLPHYLDYNGQHALSPSLYDRDAYQALLRRKPESRSGIRVDINWKGSRSTNFTLKIELRGVKGNETTTRTLEQKVKPGLFSKWTGIPFTGTDYKTFGELTSWRATLWDGTELVAEKRSFLW